MRHRKIGRKFDMAPSHRQAVLRALVTSLMIHGSIRTTEARAKEIRRYAERVISIGKRAPSASVIAGLTGPELAQAKAQRVAAIRRAKLWVLDEAALGKLFSDYAERFRTRPGGYTRVIKAGRRNGDNSPMAVIQLVEASAAE